MNRTADLLAEDVVHEAMLLDAGASRVTEEVELAAAHAIADIVQDSELSAEYIIPTVFNPKVSKAVSDAVERVARAH